jgi:hypothetical protein
MKNRHARRLAAAEHRRDLRLLEKTPPGMVPPSMVTDFFKGIALQLGQLEFKGLPEIGGHCVVHALAAYQCIRANSIDCSIGIGSLLCRIGPDERRDVVAFCGPDNMGTILPNGDVAFHCWVRYRDWVFDSSVGSWKSIDAVACELLASVQVPLLPPRWTIELPGYWLKAADEVELAWRPRGTPELGKAWYGPFFGDHEEVIQRIKMMHEDVGATIAKGLSAIFNDYCQRKGIARRHDPDRIYPLKFRTMTLRPRAT